MMLSEKLANVIGECEIVELSHPEMDDLLIQYCYGNFISIASIREDGHDLIMLHLDQINEVIDILTKLSKTKTNDQEQQKIND